MRYDMVFEGGGAKGMVFVGAMQEFEARKLEKGRLLGTSAGAITAALLAAGYSSAEMLDALNEKDGEHSVFASFMGAPGGFSEEEIRKSELRELFKKVDLPLIPNFLEDKLDDAIVTALMKLPLQRHLFSFVERGGWFSADRFVDWMQHRLDTGSLNGEPRAFSGLSMKQFFDKTQVELSLTVSDTSAGRIVIINHMTAPDCPLVWAVRMSMSIPLLWQEVVWQESWGPYLGKEIAGNVMVDGGMLSNFPIELFISSEPQVKQLMGPAKSEAVLGLLIDDEAAVPNAPALPPAQGGLGLGNLRTVTRLRHLVDTMISARDKMVIDAFEQLVVRLPAKDYGTTEFDMSDDRRAALVGAGRESMRRYLDRPKAAMAPAPAEVARNNAVADKIAKRLLRP